jgi:hypothetical protein
MSKLSGLEIEDDRPLTFKQFVAIYPEYTEAQIRWNWHNRTRNGLEKSGAIVRFQSSGRGRGRLLIRPKRYIAYLLGERSAA